jgi:uncharacterized protein YaeQ
VGQPDEKRVRKDCGRAGQVFIYTFGCHGVGVWWNLVRQNLERFGNLTVVELPARALSTLAGMAKRSMKLQFTRQERLIWVADDAETVHLDLTGAELLSGSK